MSLPFPFAVRVPSFLGPRVFYIYFLWMLQSEVVANQTMKGRGPNRSIPENGSLGSGGMTVSQLYPLYDRLVRVRVSARRSADDAYGCS